MRTRVLKIIFDFTLLIASAASPLIGVVSALALCPIVQGQTLPDKSGLAAPKIILRVGDVLISDGSVVYLQRQQLRGVFESLVSTDAAQSLARQQLIDQAVVFDYVKKQPGFRPLDVIARVVEIDDQLRRSGQTLAAALKSQGRLKSDLEFELRWQDAWRSYTRELIQDDQRVAEAGRRFARQFDGTQIEVAQLLLTIDKAVDADEFDPAQDHTVQKTQLADQLYVQLTENPGQWETLVRQHSDSPNRNHPAVAGRVGWIKFSGPMPPAFTQAAFKLEPNSISPPVRTPIGIHIVRHLSTRWGTIPPQDYAADLHRWMIKQEFQRIVAVHTNAVKISGADR